MRTMKKLKKGTYVLYNGKPGSYVHKSWSSRYPNVVMIRHTDRLETTVAFLSEISIDSSMLAYKFNVQTDTVRFT